MLNLSSNPENQGIPVMKRPVIGLICIGLILFSISHAHAQARTFTEEYTYKAGPLDNEFSSRVIAKAEARNLILDEMAEISANKLKSWGIPVDHTYNIAMLSCLTKANIAGEKWIDRSFSYEAKVKTNLDRVLGDFGTIGTSGHPTADILANRTAAVAALSETKRINADLASSADQESQRDTYAQAVNRLHATDWFEIARFSGFAGESEEAIDGYTKAIEYDPEMATAFLNRGSIYLSSQENRKLAAADLNTAKRLYFNKAVDLRKAKKYPGCVANFDDVLKINSKDAEAYFQRAYCNIGLKQQDKAKEDFIAAAKLGHEGSQSLLASKGIEW